MFKFNFLSPRKHPPPLSQKCIFSYEGPWVLSYSGTQARLWNAETGDDIVPVLNHHAPVTAVAFFPDGNNVVIGTEDSELGVWNTSTGTARITLSGGRKPILACAVTHDKRKIICGSSDGHLLILDINSQKAPVNIQAHSQAIYSCAISPDNQIIVTGSEDNLVRLWSADSGNLLRTLNGHSKGITSCAFSFDGKKIVTGSFDKGIKTWNADTGQCVHTHEGHTAAVTCVAFSADGQKIVSGSDDTTLRIWSALSGAPLGTIHCCSGSVNAVAFYPDGKTICSGLSDNSIKTWNATTGKVQNIFERRSEKKEKTEAIDKLAEILAADKLFKEGNRDEAVSRVIHLRDSIEQFVGKRNTIYIIPLQALGKMYFKMHDFTSALKNYQEVLDIQNSILGSDHQETVATTNTVQRIKNEEKFFTLTKMIQEINTLIKGGDHENAIQQAKLACNYAGEYFGKSSEEYALTLIYLSQLYQAKKEDYAKAELLLRESLEIRKKIFGTHHPEVGEIHFYLGTLVLAMGRMEEARTSINEAISIRRKIKTGWNENIARELDAIALSIMKRELDNSRIEIGKYHERGAGMPEATDFRFYR